MAEYIVRLSAGEKASLHANVPVMVTVGAGPTRDSFRIDPRHQPGFMEHLWAQQDAGLEVFVLAMMESDHVMDDIEVVP